MNPHLDAQYMAAALALAERGKGFTSPNPVVGAVVVQGGTVIGSGYHERYGGPHAEVFALAEAGERAQGATLYVTLEPCCVWGKTPPCTDAIVRAGVKAVVVPMEDPNPDISGRGLADLKAHGIEVRTGVLRDEAMRLNAGYVKFRRAGLPHVLLKLAMSLDGRVSAPPGGDRWVSSSESRERVHEMRGEADCVMVGVGTALADDPLLTDRRAGRPTRQPARLILDSSLRLPATSKLARTCGDARTIVACAATADGAAETRLSDLGVSVWRFGDGAGVDLEAVLRRAAQEGHLNILSEGGPRVASSLLGAGLVDRVAFFMAPVLYGAGGADAFGSLERPLREREVFVDAEWTEVGGDMLFEAAVARDRGPNVDR